MFRWNYLIINFLEKNIYKKKVRLRYYEVPKQTYKNFLEIKKKYNRVINKKE